MGSVPSLAMFAHLSLLPPVLEHLQVDVDPSITCLSVSLPTDKQGLSTLIWSHQLQKEGGCTQRGRGIPATPLPITLW